MEQSAFNIDVWEMFPDKSWKIWEMYETNVEHNETMVENQHLPFGKLTAVAMENMVYLLKW